MYTTIVTMLLFSQERYNKIKEKDGNCIRLGKNRRARFYNGKLRGRKTGNEKQDHTGILGVVQDDQY